MSQQFDASHPSDANDLSLSADNPAMDSSFELLDDPEESLPRNNGEDMYWYASSDSSEPIGPVSSVEIRKQITSGAINSDFLTWCKEMPQWTRVADHFDIPRNLSSDSKSLLPPPLPGRFGHYKTSKALDFIGKWHPTALVFRCLARFTIAFGLLTIVLSLFLAPFGISWFSGGLQILLIGAILELAAVVRVAFPTSATAQAHADTAEDYILQ